nr:MAG TPA: hypothetical protein [Caudoviricetes sp.]DAV63840.1 MAG TPA: hypothetical protein [Caudoviricetes sp.]
MTDFNQFSFPHFILLVDSKGSLSVAIRDKTF